MNESSPAVRVLIIDDEEVIRRSFCFQLEDLGYEVFSAANGRLGVELIEQKCPDVVLTDLRMPEMDGLAVIRYIQQHHIEAPVIVISGAGRISDAIEALRIGAHDYLIKPVSDLAMLHHAVEKALQQASLKRENKAYQEHLEQLVSDRTRELEQANLNMREFNRRLKKVVETSIGISSCLSVQDFCDHILDEFSRNLGAKSACLYQLTDTGLQLCHELEDGLSVPFIPFPLVAESFLKQVIDSGQSLLVPETELLEFINPEYQKEIQGHALLFFAVTGAQGLPVGLLVLYRKHDGVFDQQDREIGTVLASYGSETLRAVSAFESLRVSDHRYRMLFDKTNDAIFLASRHTGLFIDSNAAASRLTGCTTDELRQRKTGDIVRENITPLLRNLDESNPVQDFGLVHVIRNDDCERVARLSVVMLDPDTVVGIARDITEEQVMEGQLRRVQKLDAIGQLTGGIAHDFNNILGIILGNLDLLERQVERDPAIHKRVKTIQKSSERAAALTKQLLGFSRKQAAETRVTDINRVIDDMNNLIARSVTPDIEIEYKNTADLWLTDIDSGDFESALLNLAINARDAMAGRGRLVLETSNCLVGSDFARRHSGLKAGEYVVLSVSDTGGGISPDMQERIFEPFFTTKAPGKGTGLGLAMVFGFAERSNGHVSVDSASGSGSTFRLYLPRAIAAEKPQGLPDAGSERLPGGSETILLVDDEVELLDVARQSLQNLGYRVVVAENAEQALSQLTNEADISLMFSDVVMPGGINGYELADLAVERRPGLKVLLCSGYTGMVSQDDRPSDKLLTKPYSFSALAQSIRQLLGEPRGGEHREPDTSSGPEAPTSHDALSVGIPVVDDDHAELISLVNQCRQQTEQKASREQSDLLLKQLIDGTAAHFRREESLMAACDYPGLSNHRQVHLMLERQLKRQVRQNGQNMQGHHNLCDFLDDWLVDHISSMDVAMAVWCKARESVIETMKSTRK